MSHGLELFGSSKPMVSNGQGVTVKMVVAVLEFNVAVNVTGVEVVTALWVTMNPATDLPVGIVTVAGAEAALGTLLLN